MQSRRMRYAAGSAMVLASLASALGLLELMVRLAELRPAEIGPPRHMTMSDGRLGYRMVPQGNWHIATTEYEFHVTTNRFGYRGPEWNLSQPGVTIIGSSDAFGWGSPYEANFSALLQERLTVQGLSHEVRNIGVYGYNLEQIARDYADWQKQVPAQATILTLSSRSEKMAAVPSAFKVVEGYLVSHDRFPDGELTWAYRTYGLMYSRSRLAAVVIDRLRRMRRPHQTVEEAFIASQLTKDDVLIAVAAANRVAAMKANANGRPFGVVIADDPGLQIGYYNSLREALEARGIDVIDTREALAKHGLGAYIPYDGHWNVNGHAAIANAVVPWLIGKLSE